MNIREAVLNTAKENSPHLNPILDDVPSVKTISEEGVASAVITTLKRAESRPILSRISKVFGA